MELVLLLYLLIESGSAGMQLRAQRPHITDRALQCECASECMCECVSVQVSACVSV